MRQVEVICESRGCFISIVVSHGITLFLYVALRRTRAPTTGEGWRRSSFAAFRALAEYHASLTPCVRRFDPENWHPGGNRPPPTTPARRREAAQSAVVTAQTGGSRSDTSLYACPPPTQITSRDDMRCKNAIEAVERPAAAPCASGADVAKTVPSTVPAAVAVLASPDPQGRFMDALRREPDSSWTKTSLGSSKWLPELRKWKPERRATAFESDRRTTALAAAEAAPTTQPPSRTGPTEQTLAVRWTLATPTPGESEEPACGSDDGGFECGGDSHCDSGDRTSFPAFYAPRAAPRRASPSNLSPPSGPRQRHRLDGFGGGWSDDANDDNDEDDDDDGRGRDGGGLRALPLDDLSSLLISTPPGGGRRELFPPPLCRPSDGTAVAPVVEQQGSVESDSGTDRWEPSPEPSPNCRLRRPSNLDPTPVTAAAAATETAAHGPGETTPPAPRRRGSEASRASR